MAVLGTYSFRLASSYIIRETDDIVRISHKDCCLDRIESSPRQSRAGTTAESVVHDLTSLVMTRGVNHPIILLGQRYRLTCEYPTRTIFVSGHFWFMLVTALTTAAVPWLAELS